VVQTIQVIGSGRVGSAVAARLRERGLTVSPDVSELVLLCVPDRTIAEVAAAVEPGPWIAHTSGAPVALIGGDVLLLAAFWSLAKRMTRVESPIAVQPSASRG